MFTHPTTQQVQWQDLKVISEVDLVLNIAQQRGWKDCEVFGYGAMITEPLESLGWKLFPADLFEYSIPAEGVNRIHQIINAGVRIQGVIVADDKRRTDPPHKPMMPKVSLPSARIVFSIIGKILLGFIILAIVAGVLIYKPWLLILGAVLIFGANMDYDPKLIILVDDGNGGITWVSVLTWFD